MSGHVRVALAAPAPARVEVKDEGEALRQAIYDEPDEDAHRLVYADWLEERGGQGAARAQFIRLQCRAERLPYFDPEKEKAEAEAAKLLKKHRTKWLADLPAFVRKDRVEMVRGFPGRLRMTPIHVGRYGPDLVEKHPVTAIRLTGRTGSDETGDLALLPLLGRMRELDLSAALEQRQRALQALLASPYLTTLRRLALCSNDLGLAEARVLAAFPGLGRLEELDLRLNAVNERSLALVLEANPGKLRRLLLGGNSLALAGMEALAEWRPAAPLELLDLSNARLSARSVKALVNAPVVTGLRQLDLCGNDLDATAARTLVEAPALEKLEYLGLSRVGLDAAAKVALRGRFGDRVKIY